MSGGGFVFSTALGRILAESAAEVAGNRDERQLLAAHRFRSDAAVQYAVL